MQERFHTEWLHFGVQAILLQKCHNFGWNRFRKEFEQNSKIQSNNFCAEFIWNSAVIMDTIALKCVCKGGLGQEDAYVGDEAQDTRGVST